MIKTNSEQFARPIPHNKNTVSIPLKDKQKKTIEASMLNVTWTPVKLLNRKDIYYTLPYLPHALRVTSSIVSQLTFTGFVPFFRNKFP